MHSIIRTKRDESNFICGGGTKTLRATVLILRKNFTPCFNVTVTLISENASPRKRTSPSTRLPIIHLTWDRGESRCLTAGTLLEVEIDLLVCKVSFNAAQMIRKSISIIIINHFIQ